MSQPGSVNTTSNTKPAKPTANEQDMATKFHAELTAIMTDMEQDYGGVDGICDSKFKEAYGKLGKALEGLNEIVGDEDEDEESEG